MNFFIRSAALSVLATLLLAGCGAKGDKAATQVAAKVNGDEISVHQINFLMQRANIQPEQAKAARAQLLERLIDQDLLVRKATEKKLDRAPEVLQQLEAARRDILQRAYLASVAEGAAKPTDKDVKEFYAAHPELFSARHIYGYRVMAVQMPRNKVPQLQDMLAKNKTLEEVAVWVKEQKFPAGADGKTLPAEQLPPQLLAQFGRMKDGQIALLPTQTGVEMLQLVQSREAPRSEADATPQIQQFIFKTRQNELAQKEMKELRAAAKIEYKGDFTAPAQAAASAPQAIAPASAPSELDQGLAAGIK